MNRKSGVPRRALLAAAVVSGVLGSVPASAEPPRAVTITTQVVFNPTISGTFTASGPVCASGIIELVSEKITSGNAFNVNTQARFVCDDNSGSFVLRYHPQVVGRDSDGFDLDGPWSVTTGLGTGAYQTLSGSGWFGVVLDWTTDPLEAVETFVGFMTP
jgi:hypothetical protein